MQTEKKHNRKNLPFIILSFIFLLILFSLFLKDEIKNIFLQQPSATDEIILIETFDSELNPANRYDD